MTLVSSNHVELAVTSTLTVLPWWKCCGCKSGIIRAARTVARQRPVSALALYAVSYYSCPDLVRLMRLSKATLMMENEPPAPSILGVKSRSFSHLSHLVSFFFFWQLCVFFCFPRVPTGRSFMSSPCFRTHQANYTWDMYECIPLVTLSATSREWEAIRYVPVFFISFAILLETSKVNVHSAKNL